MRKEKTVVIEREGRDKGKTFVLTEMPALQLEHWAARALVALCAGNVPVDIAQAAKVSSAAALASMLQGVLSGLSWEAIQPLYDELLGCVARVPNPDHPKSVVWLNAGNVDSHVEEVPTLVQLRLEALELNLGFFGAASGLFSRLSQGVTRKD